MSFQALGMLVSAAVTLVIGVRLLRLARRTGELPEVLIGLAFTLQGGLTSACFLTLRLTGGGASLGAAALPVGLLAWLSMAVGALCVGRFTWCVFRTGPLGAALFALCLVPALASLVGIALFEREVLLGGPPGASAWWRLGIAARIAIYGWVSVEAWSYFGKMRRRRALGLADPLLTNRFALWGATAGAIVTLMVLSAGKALGVLPIGDDAMTVLQMTLTVAATAGNWLVFFPPGWYRRRVAAAPGA